MAATATVTLAPEVIAVLQQSTITTDRVMLPNRLDRKLYERVDKALTLAGGKWNRSARAHLFNRDPREILASALESGSMTDTKKLFQVFETPRPVAERMIFLAGYDCEQILEPSAGSGGVVRAIKSHSKARVDCVEIRPEACADLRRLGCQVIEDDFLNVTPRCIYDAVIGNPPFTKGQDARHALHAWEFVRPGGKLVMIVSPAFQFRETAVYSDMKAMHDEYGFHEEELPEGTFKAEGTNVRTFLIGWAKP